MKLELELNWDEHWLNKKKSKLIQIWGILRTKVLSGLAFLFTWSFVDCDSQRTCVQIRFIGDSLWVCNQRIQNERWDWTRIRLKDPYSDSHLCARNESENLSGLDSCSNYECSLFGIIGFRIKSPFQSYSLNGEEDSSYIFGLCNTRDLTLLVAISFAAWQFWSISRNY